MPGSITVFVFSFLQYFSFYNCIFILFGSVFAARTNFFSVNIVEEHKDLTEEGVGGPKLFSAFH